jgi:hypothetical protein
MENNVDTLKKTARFAGLLYLLVVITGVYGIMFVSSQINLRGEATVVANNILSNEFLFRTGIINDFISNFLFLFLVLVLYKLLRQVNEHRAKLMVALVVVQVPAAFIMEVFNITSLMIFKGEILNALELNQRQDLAMLFLKINDYGVLILELFWGIWLIPLAQLVYKSGFIPRIIAILLLINGIAYMFDSAVFMILPSLHVVTNQYLLIFIIPGEISIMLWLLIKGVKNNVTITDPKI